jgi:hypothetical protein
MVKLKTDVERALPHEPMMDKQIAQLAYHYWDESGFTCAATEGLNVIEGVLHAGCTTLIRRNRDSSTLSGVLPDRIGRTTIATILISSFIVRSASIRGIREG